MIPTPVKAIRQKCRDCCGDNVKLVAYCACDGLNSTRCALWPYRFGKRPAAAARKFGAAMLDPRQMPDPNEHLDSLPPHTEFSRQGVASLPSASASGTSGLFPAAQEGGSG